MKLGVAPVLLMVPVVGMVFGVGLLASSARAARTCCRSARRRPR